MICGWGVLRVDCKGGTGLRLDLVESFDPYVSGMAEPGLPSCSR